MTEIQFLTLLGAIYLAPHLRIAPHLRKDFCFVIGVAFLIFASGKELGLI
jgi:hypothetical protein